jgi:hypothetical protein
VRAVLVILRAAAVTIAVVSLAAFALVAADSPVALHAGDAVTDRQLFAFLSLPPHSGDWVRYRVTFADSPAVEKTIGFGAETVDGNRTLFIETHVHASAVNGLPSSQPVSIGTDAVLKTYVEGSSFGDLAHVYTVITSAIQVGNLEYEVKPGPHERFSVLSGTVNPDPRQGIVTGVEPVDLRVGDTVLHCSRVAVSFGQAPLPMGGMTTAYALTVWQSPDAPLGTVAIESGGDAAVRWSMAAFGRGTYRSMFRQTLDQIRAAALPSQ